MVPVPDRCKSPAPLSLRNSGRRSFFHDHNHESTNVAGFSIWESLKASADLQQVQENLKASGVTNPEIEKATRAAFDIGQKFGLTARDVLQGINEIRNPLNKRVNAPEGA